MKSILKTILILAYVAVTVFAEDSSRTVQLTQLPVAVQKTIQDESAKGSLGEIDEVVEYGETRYDFEVTKGKDKRSFSVNPAGRLTSRQVFMRELSEATRQTIRKHIGHHKLGEIDADLENDPHTYDVEFTKNGRELSFTVSADGKLIDEEITLTEAPDSVQKAIQQKTGKGSINSIQRNFDEDEVTYEVEITRDGKDQTFILAPDGKLVSEEIKLTDTPPVAQKAIQQKLSTGTLISLKKSYEDGEFSFDIEMEKDGKTISFNVDSEGNVSED